MINDPISKIYKEKNALLDEWMTVSGERKLKILVRLMDIDDELNKLDKGGDSGGFSSRKRRPVPGVFQKS